MVALYKKMKSNGTSIYVFQNSAIDLNLAFNNPNYKFSFDKFALLNIPQQSADTSSWKGLMNFDYVTSSEPSVKTPFFSINPNGKPTLFSDQLIESLRNYVANNDENIREAKISSNKDFYNISELQTTTEKIFWKWCRKIGILDLEIAKHRTDWDKNNPDFENPNGSTITNTDYFRKYLWKERESEIYTLSNIVAGSDYTMTINDKVKYKVGDFIKLTGNTTGTGYYKITSVSIDIVNSISTIVIANEYALPSIVSGSTIVLTSQLRYNKLIQYIGEIGQQSNTQTSKSNFQEVTAFIPTHAGKTPTVLFENKYDLNYYPNAEYPVLAQDIQPEILGAEDLNSPIRTNPDNYPGLYYGLFDNTNKTYKNSDGDQIRLNGDYFGINLVNNTGLRADDYFEKLSDFNSNNIDGTGLDFNYNHYIKMSIPNYESANFDEFNSVAFNGISPEDFDFNAVLWYYKLDDGNGNIVRNLFGITFVNNPNNDLDPLDTEGQLITPYQKLVSNENQDGVSYIFNLNLNYEIDNDQVAIAYDPSSVYNMFGFDMYNNVMSNLAKLNEKFIGIVDSFLTLNKNMLAMQTQIYSQTDIEDLKAQMSNMTELLKLYKTNQFVDSSSAKISIDNTKVYPSLSFNVVEQEFTETQTLLMSEIIQFNTTAATDYNIIVPDFNKKLLQIINDDTAGVDMTPSIILNQDLSYKQSFEIYIKADNALYSKNLKIYLNYDNGANTGVVKTDFIDNVYSPVDLSTASVSGNTFNRTHYNNSIITNYSDVLSETGLTLNYLNVYTINKNIFNTNEYVYIDNFVFLNTLDDSINDLSGLWIIEDSEPVFLTIDVKTRYPSFSLTTWNLLGIPKIMSYKGVKILISNINSDTTSTITDRYLIEREYF